MFIIEKVFVEDKNVPLVLRALAGLVRDMTVPKPVANVHEGGKGAPKAATTGSIIAMFEAYLAKSKKIEITPEEIRAWLTSHGKSAASSPYVAKLAVEHHMLRRAGKSGNMKYIINHKKG